MSQPYVKVTTDLTSQINAAIKKFKYDAVLVGIPAQDTDRDHSEGDEGSITNAALLAINNFGSPANNIPARPVMQIGIKNAQDAIALEFKRAASAVLSKAFAAIDQYYERAGSIAANSIKKAINDQDGFPGPAPATLVDRYRRGFKGTKSLVVTGQMRNAITYVVNNGGL